MRLHHWPPLFFQGTLSSWINLMAPGLGRSTTWKVRSHQPGGSAACSRTINPSQAPCSWFNRPTFLHYGLPYEMCRGQSSVVGPPQARLELFLNLGTVLEGVRSRETFNVQPAQKSSRARAPASKGENRRRSARRMVGLMLGFSFAICVPLFGNLVAATPKTVT